MEPEETETTETTTVVVTTFETEKEEETTLIVDAETNVLAEDKNTISESATISELEIENSDIKTTSENDDRENVLSTVSEMNLAVEVVNVATESNLFGNEDGNEYENDESKSRITPIYKNGFISPNFTVEKVKKNENFSGLFGDSPLPAFYDARTETNDFGVSIIPPVRDQYPYGTCWAFSTIGMIETSVRKKNYVQSEGDPGADLSEAAMAYFTLEGLEDVTNDTNNIDKPGLEGHDYSSLNYDYYANMGIPRASISFADAGGNQTAATLLASTYMGIVSEADFPHTVENITDIHENGIGDRGRFAFNNNRYEILNADYINKNDITTIKEAILKNGSVGISYCESRNENKWGVLLLSTRIFCTHRR